MTIKEIVEREAYCPRCMVDRTFTKQPKLVTQPLELYACGECRINVSVVYLRNQAYQKALRNGR